MRQRTITIFSFMLCLVSLVASASVDDPVFHISFEYTDGEGEHVDSMTTFEGSAPITAIFHVETENADDWNVYYEWRVCREDGNLDEPYLVRREESPEITFTQAGLDSIGLYAVCTREEAGETVTKTYWRDYWSKEQYLTIKTSDSDLTFPNAFSPNGDSHNDTYKPKTHKSIIEFHATIFSRWGQKIYEWRDVNSEGWDGTFNGRDVKQGVYFMYCTAKGADGRKFNIRKDVNLLRDYSGEVTGGSGGGGDITM